MYKGLGFVATGKRAIRSGAEYNRYFNLGAVANKEVVIVDDGLTDDTINAMQRIVSETLSQTKSIAQALRGSSREATARNIWNFLYNHVQYTIDAGGREQLREPLRTWKDRARGVDCDCYSIFISSVLTNLGVPHALRITKYRGDWQHVYVVVPKSGSSYSSYYIIDPVTDRFNFEVAFSGKKDFPMEITRLSGPFGECPSKVVSNMTQSPESSADQPAGASLKPIVFYTKDELQAQKLTSTYDVLDKAGIPYTSYVDDKNNVVIEAQTPSGNIQMPTFLASSMSQYLTQAGQSVNSAVSTVKNSNAAKWVLGLGALALVAWAMSGKKKSAPTLSGPPRKKAQRRLSVAHI